MWPCGAAVRGVHAAELPRASTFDLKKPEPKVVPPADISPKQVFDKLTQLRRAVAFLAC